MSDLMYLTPLFLNRNFTVFRRTLGAGLDDSVDKRTFDSRLGHKRCEANSIAWIEFTIGPYVFSLNHI